MRKGLFWVISESGERWLLTFAAECGKDGVLLDGQPSYNSRKGDSFAHKNSWETAAKDCSREVRCKPWNYYPRGRVEIKNGKAVVYHNPAISEWSDFETDIIRVFELDSFPVKFVPDGSAHYQYSEEDLR